ncbi:MAG: hypothetical protein EU529_15945 [Promethearchaeota archaeon]|nr:MAG: hypothetical protein EU529_15945 [Candidatus Lokiarchaeota archaeon]
MDYDYGKIAGFSSLIACIIVIFSFIVGKAMFDRGGVEILSGILFGIATILAFSKRHHFSSYGNRYGSVCCNFLGIVLIIGYYIHISLYADIFEWYGIEFIFIFLLDAIAIIFAVIGMITYVLFYFIEAPL